MPCSRSAAGTDGTSEPAPDTGRHDLAMATNGTLGFDPIAEARHQWEAHGWGTAAAGMEAVTAVMRVQQLLLAAIDEALEPFGLTFARFELLALLSFTREGALPARQDRCSPPGAPGQRHQRGRPTRGGGPGASVGPTPPTAGRSSPPSPLRAGPSRRRPPTRSTSRSSLHSSCPMAISRRSTWGCGPCGLRPAIPMPRARGCPEDTGSRVSVAHMTALSVSCDHASTRAA